MSIDTTTIGNLDSGGPLVTTDLFVIERVGGANFNVTAQEVADFVDLVESHSYFASMFKTVNYNPVGDGNDNKWTDIYGFSSNNGVSPNDEQRQRIPRTGIIRNLDIRVYSNSLDVDTTIAVAYDNVDTGLLITVPAGVGFGQYNIAIDVPVTVGHVISIHCLSTGSAGGNFTFQGAIY